MAAKRGRSGPRPRSATQTKKNKPASTPARPATATATAARPPKPTREERIEANRRARRRRELRNRIITWAVAVVVAAALVAYVVNDRRQTQRLVSALEAGSCDFDRDSDPGRDHVVAATYRVDPPAGGDHDAAATSAGVYTSPSVPADANLVHSLEHGFVILWHRTDLPEPEREQLVQIRGRFPRDILVVERPALETPVAATAWHKRLLCSALDVEALGRFADEFRNDGPEDVPHP